MPNEFFRYLIAGLINSLVGYLAFLGALNAAGLNIFFSNLLSYAIGLIVAYTLNMVFVFKGRRHTASAPFIFILGFCFSYGVNLLTLYALIEKANLPAELAQLFAMASYTITFYLVNKFFVFQKWKEQE